jgi:hypothetical protein
MVLAWPNKDPDEILDYIVDWTARLAGDTIISSVFTVPVGITQNSAAFTATKTTVWLSGGTLDSVYEVLNRVVTLGGRTMDQTVKIRIRRK